MICVLAKARQRYTANCHTTLTSLLFVGVNVVINNFSAEWRKEENMETAFREFVNEAAFWELFDKLSEENKATVMEALNQAYQQGYRDGYSG